MAYVSRLEVSREELVCKSGIVQIKTKLDYPTIASAGKPKELCLLPKLLPECQKVIKMPTVN